MKSLLGMVSEMQTVVCCGAGGVGKTTVSAALAVAAARAGRRVLVLTIDPSRRLAETLGISASLPEPIPLPADRLAAVGVRAPGSIDGWVLDPARIADRVVGRLADSPEDAARLKNNRIYQGVSNMVAGMQEYTAVEALHTLSARGRYELIILETPPSRNALSFLDAPIRLGKFLDGRIFKLFLPADDGLFSGAARRVTKLVLTTVLGKEGYADLTSFLGSFSVVFKVLGGNAEAMRERLQQPDSTFLMVTTSAQAAIYDALHFRKRLDRLQLACGGFVLNRSLPADEDCPMAEPSMLEPNADPITQSALEKLAALGSVEQEMADSEGAIIATLEKAAGEEGVALPLPEIPGGVEDMEGLERLVWWMESREI
jgi:anion-transporting  ArsA/GET3 family ATPase